MRLNKTHVQAKLAMLNNKVNRKLGQNIQVQRVQGAYKLYLNRGADTVMLTPGYTANEMCHALDAMYYLEVGYQLAGQ